MFNLIYKKNRVLWGIGAIAMIAGIFLITNSTFLETNPVVDEVSTYKKSKFKNVKPLSEYAKNVAISENYDTEYGSYFAKTPESYFLKNNSEYADKLMDPRDKGSEAAWNKIYEDRYLVNQIAKRILTNVVESFASVEQGFIDYKQDNYYLGLNNACIKAYGVSDYDKDDEEIIWLLCSKDGVKPENAKIVNK